MNNSSTTQLDIKDSYHNSQQPITIDPSLLEPTTQDFRDGTQQSNKRQRTEQSLQFNNSPILDVTFDNTIQPSAPLAEEEEEEVQGKQEAELKQKLCSLIVVIDLLHLLTLFLFSSIFNHSRSFCSSSNQFT